MTTSDFGLGCLIFVIMVLALTAAALFFAFPELLLALGLVVILISDTGSGPSANHGCCWMQSGTETCFHVCKRQS